jgi:hypothetical protein
MTTNVGPLSLNVDLIVPWYREILWLVYVWENMSPANRRAIRKIIFENLEYLVSEYQKLHPRGA